MWAQAAAAKVDLKKRMRKLHMHPDWRLKWTGLRPLPDKLVCIGQVVGTLHGTWFYSNVMFDESDLHLSDDAFKRQLDCKLDLALEKLIELAEDPFERWVRGCREDKE